MIQGTKTIDAAQTKLFQVGELSDIPSALTWPVPRRKKNLINKVIDSLEDCRINPFRVQRVFCSSFLHPKERTIRNIFDRYLKCGSSTEK